MIEIRCYKCDRFIPLEVIDTIITKVRCTDRKCKEMNGIKIVTGIATNEQLRYKVDIKLAKVKEVSK